MIFNLQLLFITCFLFGLIACNNKSGDITALTGDEVRVAYDSTILINPRKLELDGEFYHPTISPDGNKVLLTKKHGTGLYYVNLGKSKIIDNTRAVKLNDLLGVGKSAYWSESGNEVIYFDPGDKTMKSHGIHSFDVSTISAKTAKVGDSTTIEMEEIISNLELGLADSYCTSPDLLYLMASVMVAAEDHGKAKADLYFYSLDGSRKAQLTRTPALSEMQPSWSAKGNIIAYCDAENGDIYLAEISLK